MECLRLYPIVPMSMRNVINTCVVEGYELPVGLRLIIAQTATRYMAEVFPEHSKFDIDRYLPRAVSTSVPGTRHTAWARTPASGRGGWTSSCL